MQITLVTLVDFLPRFIIAGVITYFFISRFNKLYPLEFERPFIFLQKDEYRRGIRAYFRRKMAAFRLRAEMGGTRHAMVTTYGPVAGTSSSMGVTLLSKPQGNRKRMELVRELQMILLGIDVWILLSIALSPIKSIYYILPRLPSVSGTVLYSAVAATLFVAVIGTVISRVRIDGKITIGLLAGSAVTTVILFYMPSMGWMARYGTFMQVAIVYSVVIAVCLAVYMISFHARRRTAFYASAFSSMAVYAIWSVLMFMNLIMNIFES